MFAKSTVGVQFTTAIDSISANIAEGFGRYGKKDKVKFYYYSFGSVKESFDWNEKAKVRKLLTNDQYDHIMNLNNYQLKFITILNSPMKNLKNNNLII